jgi:hypothetical protein
LTKDALFERFYVDDDVGELRHLNLRGAAASGIAVTILSD